MLEQSKWNVIVVDDEKDNVGVIQMVFEFNDAKVRPAYSGKECLMLLEQEVPSFLLVDINMPEMSGYQLLEKIRENEAWRSVPIIAVTALARPEDKQDIMNAGFDGYIGKPITIMTLIEQVSKILEAKG